MKAFSMIYSLEMHLLSSTFILSGSLSDRNEVLEILTTLICNFSQFALILIHEMKRKLIRISMKIDKNKIKLQGSLSFMYLTCVAVKLAGNSRVEKASGWEHLFNMLVSLFSLLFTSFQHPKISPQIVAFIQTNHLLQSFIYLNWPTCGIKLLFIFSWSMLLPVSTYSLICSSQLAFNAFFSYFLNSH